MNHEPTEEVDEEMAWPEEIHNFNPNGKGKGKGKGPECWNCGQHGHRKAECPYLMNGEQDFGGKGWPSGSWQKGGWVNGGKNKGKGWPGKGNGKNQSGKWGKTDWLLERERMDSESEYVESKGKRWKRRWIS